MNSPRRKPFSSIYLFPPRICPIVEGVLQRGRLQSGHDSTGISNCVLFVALSFHSYFFAGVFAIAAFAYKVFGEVGCGGVIGIFEIGSILESPSCVGVHVHKFAMRMTEHSFR